MQGCMFYINRLLFFVVVVVVVVVGCCFCPRQAHPLLKLPPIPGTEEEVVEAMEDDDAASRMCLPLTWSERMFGASRMELGQLIYNNLSP